MKKRKLVVTFSVLFSILITTFSPVVGNANLAVTDAQQDCAVVSESDSNSSGSTGEDNSGTTSSEVPNPDNIKEIYEYAHGTYGLSGTSIAGILANWWQESGIDPRTVEGYYGESNKTVEVAKANTGGMMGIGYGQWTAGRHQALVAWADKNFKGEWWTTKAQLDFMFKGDGGFVPILKSYAISSGSDVVANTVEFHRTWEISADSEDYVINGRGGYAKTLWAYMQKHGMDGEKDKSKIEKISVGGVSDPSAEGSSSANSGGETTDFCKISNIDDSGTGKLGESVPSNGRHGSVVGGAWDYENVPEQYKKAMTLPKFKEPDWSNSPFKGELAGQCTELTWAYMTQLYDGKQPTMGHGGVVWQSYDAAGAKITTNPTVGYGFSAPRGYTGATTDYGHTGVVLAVFPDGTWLAGNFNYPPYNAPARKIVVTLIDGNDGNIKFFSGIGKSKVEEK